MHLIFGATLDAAHYPDFPGDVAVLGASVVGPAGLLDILETGMGMVGPPIGHTTRVAAYAAKLKSYLSGAPNAFYADSFQNDPWASADTLLRWRDDLIAAGWRATAGGGERLDALSAIEGLDPLLPAGIADRARLVTEALKNALNVPVSSLALLDPKHLLAPIWRSLIETLAARGALVAQINDAPASSAQTDLGRAQIYVSSGQANTASGDGSLTFLDADTEQMAAEAVAEWIAAGDPADLAGTLVIAADGDTALLDQALSARGLPKLGLSRGSPLRGVLQTLPLAFELAWAPFDPRTLLQLLLLPRPPIGRFAAQRLARALTQEPGLGGPAWQAAWAEIEEHETARAAEREETDASLQRRLETWRCWTQCGGHSRLEGIPTAEARAIAHRVATWALQIDASDANPLMLALASAASALAQAVDILKQDTLPALLLARMIEHVVADGAKNPNHIANAGGLRVAAGPENIWGPADRIIWWNFVGQGRRAARSPWSVDERATLRDAGCPTPSIEIDAENIAWSYAHGLRMCTKQMIFVRPALSGAGETTSHPLSHQLEPIVCSNRDKLTYRAETLLHRDNTIFANRRIQRNQAIAVTLPAAKSSWTVPTRTRAAVEKRRESATSLERMLDCPLRWLALDVLRLSRGRFAEIPGTDQLLGNIAHAIAQIVLQPGAPPDSHTARNQAEAAFDNIVAMIAAPLQQPGAAGDLALARRRIPLSIADLAKHLKDHNLIVVGSELEREASFGTGLNVSGRLDLVVRDAQGHLAIIDLKWTRSEKYRREQIAEGRALQLAIYGAILEPSSEAVAPGGFYLLNQRKLLTPQGSPLGGEEIAAARSPEQTWTDLVATWRHWRDAVSGGVALATGLSGDLHVPAPIKPPKEPCTYCEFRGLCRVGAEAAA